MSQKKTRFLAIASLVCLLALSALLFRSTSDNARAQTSPPPSRILPFSYYKLDNLNDSRGVHNATAVGTSVVTGPSTNLGNARSLNGTSDYLNLGGMTEFDNAQKLTVAAWVKFSSGAQQSFITKWGTQSSQNAFWTDFASGCPRAAFGVGQFIQNTAGTGGTCLNSVAGSSWRHVAWVYDGTAPTNETRLKLYVDGAPESLDFGSYTVPAKLPQTTSAVNVGSYNGGTGFFFSGQVDEVGLWSASVTQEMVKFLYNAGAGRTFADISDADTLHRESVILLAHTHDFLPADLRQARAAGVTGVTAKLTVDGIDWDRASRRRYAVDGLWRQRFLYYLRQVQATADLNADVVVARTAQDILDAKQDGKIAVVLGSEGANQLHGDGTLDPTASGYPQTAAPTSAVMQARMEEYYGLGWRETQLCWDKVNDLWNAGSNPPTPGSLTTLGQDFVTKANSLGILIDVSHLPAAALADVLNRTSDPVIISHDTTHNAGSSVTDQMLQDIAASGGGHGVIAVHFFSSYYNGSLDRTKLFDVINELKNMQGVGVDHIALGGDYFSEDFTNQQGWVLPLDDLSDVTVGLLNRGYTELEVKKILGQNLLDLYGRVW